MDPRLNERGQAKIVRKTLPSHTEVVRIVLTGGPCAGKSSALSHLCKAATAEGFDVLTAPETATLFFNCGWKFPSPGLPDFQQQVLEFQKQNLGLQIALERSMTALATSSKRPTIVVFDRGLFDPKAYLTPELWSTAVEKLIKWKSFPEAIDTVKAAEKYMCERYDACIHLVTAADGADHFYKCGTTVDDSGGVVHRRETAQEAIDLDQKLERAWHDHLGSTGKHIVVRNEAGGFAQKLSEATEAVLRVARKKYPLIKSTKALHPSS